MRTLCSLTIALLGGAIACGVSGAAPAEVAPESRPATAPAPPETRPGELEEVQREIRRLELQRRQIDAQLRELRREAERLRRAERQPRYELRIPREAPAQPFGPNAPRRPGQRPPELRIVPDVQPLVPAPEQVPPDWLPGEINGLRFYIVPLE